MAVSKGVRWCPRQATTGIKYQAECAVLTDREIAPVGTS